MWQWTEILYESTFWVVNMWAYVSVHMPVINGKDKTLNMSLPLCKSNLGDNEPDLTTVN